MASVQETVEILFKANAGASLADIGQIGQGIDQVGENAREASTSLSQLDGELSELGEPALDKVATDLNDVSTQAKEAKSDIGLMDDELAGLGDAALDNLQSELDQVGTEARQAGDGAEIAGDKFEDLGNRGTSKVDALTNAFKVLAASMVVKEFIDANVAFETLSLTLTTLTGSQAEAAKEMEYIKYVSDQLGLEVTKTGQAYAQFLAVTRGTALEGEGAREIFEAIAGTMAQMGKSTEDTTGVLTQLGQGISKGKFELEDLKSIAERGIPIFDIMAESLGVNKDMLFEMISKGEITGDVMLRVADSLKQSFGDVAYVDTFQAAWTRLQNSIDEAFVMLGESGAMGVAKTGVEGLTLTVIGTIATFELLGKTLANMAYTLTSLDFSGYQGRQQALVDEYAETVEKARSRFLGLDDDLRKVEASGTAAGDAIKDGMEKGAAAANTFKEDAKKVDEALKALGLDPKQFIDPVKEATAGVQAAIADMVNNGASGDKLLAGVVTAIDKLAGQDLVALKAAIDGAFENGQLSADQYAVAIDALKTKQDGLWPTIIKSTDATKAQADEQKKAAEEMRKAEEAANKLLIELEKIASNERIKAMEFAVNFKIAEMEADAKKAEAVMQNMREMYKANSDAIVDLLNGISDSARTPADLIKLNYVSELDKRQKEIHDATMKQINQQIEYMAAKTSAIASGNPIMTIQAPGLQPHLEAFMWEILKAIQVKMAYEGGDMLTGGCSL